MGRQWGSPEGQEGGASGMGGKRGAPGGRGLWEPGMEGDEGWVGILPFQSSRFLLIMDKSQLCRSRKVRGF